MQRIFIWLHVISPNKVGFQHNTNVTQKVKHLHSTTFLKNQHFKYSLTALTYDKALKYI